MDYDVAAHPWYEDIMEYLDTQTLPPTFEA